MKPVTFLNNASGFTAAQITNLNGMIKAQENRWQRKVKQKEISQEGITTGITKVSGVISIGTPYCNNNIIYAHGYLNLGALTDEYVDIIQTERNITGYYIAGTSSVYLENNRDLSFFVTFSQSDDKIKCKRIQTSNETFEVTIVIGLENK